MTVLSKPLNSKVAERIQHHVKSFPPPISYSKSKRVKEKKESSDYREFDMRLDPKDDKSQKTKKSCLVFEDGDPEMWCEWRRQVDDLCRLMGVGETEATKIEKIILALLRGKALESFTTYKAAQNAANALRGTSKWDDEKVLLHTLNDMALEIFPSKHSYRRQVFYMKYHLFIGDGITVKEFENRVNWMNQSLKYFPLIKLRNGQFKVCKALEEDQLCDIMNIAKKPEWTAQMMMANVDPYDLTLDQLTEYLERLEVVDAMKVNHTPKKVPKEPKKETKTKRTPEDDSRPSKRSRYKACDICGKKHKGECWYKKSKGDNTKDERFKPGSGTSKKKLYTLEEINELSSVFFAQTRPEKRKRKKSSSSSDDEESGNMFRKMSKHRNNTSSDEDSDYMHAYPIMDPHRPPKKAKKGHRTSEIVVQIAGTTQILRALVDSGASSSIILRRFVPDGMLSKYKHPRTQWRTMGGTYTTQRKAHVKFSLPEFSLCKKVTWSFHVDDANKDSQYDMIIGEDILNELKMDLLYSKDVPSIQWENVVIPMKEKGFLSAPTVLQTVYSTVVDESSPTLKAAEDRRIRILDTAKDTYAEADLEAFVRTLSHLQAEQQDEILDCLRSCDVLFSGGLATATVQPIDLELVADAKPYHIKRAFSIPRIYRDTTEKEINRLCAIGVLEKRSDSEWACGTFIVPKKTHDVRVVTDFRILNTMLVRRPFPIPKIKDLLQSLQGFTYASAIDLSMGYYSIPLSEQAQELTTFLLPWGKYRYKRLPMGIKVASDVFQETMIHILGDLPYVQVYIDDVLVLTDGSYTDHCNKLREVLFRLNKYNFRCRPDKCFFAVQGIEYLGYWLDRQGLRPQTKKVEAIHRMVAPANKKQLRRFLGMVNYYRDMWKRRSHILAPLTSMTSNKSIFKWGEEQQQAFDEIKRVISRETMLKFPQFDKEFHVYTDASDYQLGGVIMQDDKPLAFYSRKLNAAQKNYTTGEKELLSIVETLREFRDILLGYRLIVHTDHKNLLYRKLPSQRIVRWRLLLEEYDVQYEHVKGIDNVVADGISRLDSDETPLNSKPEIAAQCYALCHIQRDESVDIVDVPDDEDFASSYVNQDEIEEEEFPMAPSLIAQHQRNDRALRKAKRVDPKNYSIKEVEGISLIHYKEKIYVPHKLRSRIISWYHEYLAHPGAIRLESTIGQLFTWPNLSQQARWCCKSCSTCQLWKCQRKKYGHLPTKEAEVEPWTQVHVDLMGPLTVKQPNGKPLSFLAFTAIDPATGWFECSAIPNSQSYVVMEAFHNTWLCRYPRPQKVRFDNGGEFKSVFLSMCKNFHIKDKPTTAYNPRSNGIIERVHQVLRDSLATFELSEQDLPANNPFDSFIAAASWAIPSAYHTTLQATPGQLVFGRDMILGLKFKVNWAAIRMRKQALINKGVERENRSRIQHDYSVGDKVLYTKPGIVPKMDAPRTGPFEIRQVYTNGTVSIQRGAVSDRVNIRNITPFFE